MTFVIHTCPNFFALSTRMYLRDLIDTTNVYMKMMEKFCQGSVVVQTKVKKDKKKKKKANKNATKKATESKKPSKEEVMVRKFDKQLMWVFSINIYFFLTFFLSIK